MHSADLCLWTVSPRAELACWTVEFLSFWGGLILQALFSSGDDCVWTSWKQCTADLDCSVYSARLFCEVWLSGLTFPIWLVFSGRTLLAGISNHHCCGIREALLTCCISHTPPLISCKITAMNSCSPVILGSWATYTGFNYNIYR